MGKIIIGRKEEQRTLQQALKSPEAEMIAIIGRRRVGKTFLVKQVLGDRIIFELTGLQDTPTAGQLQNFGIQLGIYAQSAVPTKDPKNWLEAFSWLAKFLEPQLSTEKKVVFLDELPWLAGPKSGFLTGLSWFWNSWAVNKHLVVVICGSAASWMIQKVVNNRGGLHNRITKRIFLQPFTLSETEEYLRSKNIAIGKYQLLQLYMVLGGIPHYLKEVQPGKSATQNIDDLCFSTNGLLTDEFPRLFPSLFFHSEVHEKIARTLAQNHLGLTRQEIVEKGQLSEGGNTSRALEELEQSGFVTAYRPFGKKKKDFLFRLTDEYSLFYLRFIEPHKGEGTGTWNHLSQTQAAKTWSGYAYENICLKSLSPIKKALGISGVYTVSSSFYQRGNEQEAGAQIDLVLDRHDQTINLFEIKFYNSEWAFTEADAKSLRNKVSVFQEKTKTKKAVIPVLITTYGIHQNRHSLGLVDQVLVMEDLFG